MQLTSDQVAEVYADNCCGMTRQQLVEMHARRGYVLDNCEPADFRTAQIAACRPEVRAFAKDVADGKAAGLVLTGRAGRGKTYAACAVMRDVSGSVGVGLATDAELVRKAKASFGDRGATEEGVIAAFARPYLLTLDDFGKAAYTSDWATQLVFEVLDQRAKRRKPTIVTTQYNAAQLVEKLTVNGDSATAEAVVSRLRPFSKVRLDGPDLRGAVRNVA